MKNATHCSKQYGIAHVLTQDLFAKTTLVTILSFFCSCGTAPTDIPRYSKYTPYCHCEDEFEGQVLQLITPDEREELNLEKILKIQGISLRPYKLCKTEEIPGTVSGYAKWINGLPYIIYDASQLNAYSSNWSSVALMSHELGHHVNMHTLDFSTEKHRKELEAEYYSGGVLYKMGATLQEAMDTKSETMEASITHPSGSVARKSIKQGWMDASQLNPDQPDPFAPVLNAPPKRSKANLGGKWYTTIIVGDREIMAEDLAYKIGGASCYDNKRRCSGFLYSIVEAERACRANGWELISTNDFMALINYYTYGKGNDDFISTQNFDAVQAYGALLKDGKGGFNARLGGFGYFSSNGIIYQSMDLVGLYWVAERDRGHDEPLYYMFNLEEGTLVRYRTGNTNYLMSCRCARKIP